MGTSRYSSYTFDSDYPGSHEICVWPTSEKGYIWRLEYYGISKKIKLESEVSFDGATKGEIKILNFTLPRSLEKNEVYWVYFYINNVKQYTSCSTYKSRAYPLTDFFAKIIEKLRNITQSIF